MLGPILDILALHGDRPQPLDIPKGWHIGPFQWVATPNQLGPAQQELVSFRAPAAMVDPQIRSILTYGPGNTNTPEDPDITLLVTGIGIEFTGALTRVEMTELSRGMYLEYADNNSTVYLPLNGSLRTTARDIAGAGGAAANEFETVIGYSRATLGAILPVYLKNQRLRVLYGLDPNAPTINIAGNRVLITMYGAARAGRDADRNANPCAAQGGVGASQREARALPSPLLPGQT